MGRVLLINGSPRGKGSNTIGLARAFAKGLAEAGGYVTTEITLADGGVEHCRGCFACWKNSPGRCVIKDDMAHYLKLYIESDLIIWSLPLYYYSMPSVAKAFMDRLLPLNLPIIASRDDGTATHPSRYDLSEQGQVLISTCGFYSKERNYDALKKQFDILGCDYSILCPEGELFSVGALKGRTDAYLGAVEQAGREYAGGGVSSATEAILDEPLYPPEVFMEMANNNWGPQEETGTAGETSRGEAESFLRQMAAIYNPRAWRKDITLEMHFTDRDETYQLRMDSKKCRVIPGSDAPFTTRIETPYEVWTKISQGKIQGAQAMMDGLYKVKGDFDTMNRMGALFGTEPTPSMGKKSNMLLLLLPWIALWALLPIDALSHWGGAAGALLGVLSLSSGFRYTLTPYDRIGAIMAACLGLAAALGFASSGLISITYLLFGLMWFVSARTTVPLTAWYSCDGYGGDEAFVNPLFIKTNRIITDCWGGLYLVSALVSLTLSSSPIREYTGIINQAGPILLGVFTAWFQKWYPAKVARG